MARRGRDNFRFTTVELSALALSFIATSVLVFLLGFYVGRRVAAEHMPVGENVARVPVGAPPSDDAARWQAPRAAAPGTAARAPSQPAAQTGAKAAPSSASNTQAAQKPVSAPSAAPPSPPARPTPMPPAPISPPPAPSAVPGVPYTVQVLATRNRNEAESLANNLKRKGYGAYMLQIEDAGGTWYRVRIGHYDSADSARRTAERVSKELGLTQAYVSPLTSGSR